MRRVLRIFDLSKSEQRVVLIVMFVLIVFALAAYERRVHQRSVQPSFAIEVQPSPSPVQDEDER
jgi:hypothetical protein